MGTIPLLDVLAAYSPAQKMSARTSLELDEAVLSDVTGVTGADPINNIISLTADEYDAIVTKDPNTLYVITDVL